MNPAAKSRMQLMACTGLALAALLLLVPTAGHTVTLNVTDDTFISLNNPIKNFGSRKNVKVDDQTNLQGFVRFDLTVLGTVTASQVESAIMRMWITKVKVAGEVEFHEVTVDSWTEGTLTAGTGLTTVLFLGNFGIDKTDQGTFVLVDVTDLVKAWITGDNHGIAILPKEGTRIVIDSKEGKKTSRPMEIEVILGLWGAGATIIGGGTGGTALLSTDPTSFVPMFDGEVSLTEDFVHQVMPVAGTVKNFNVIIDTAPVAALATWTFTVKHRHVVSGIGC